MHESRLMSLSMLIKIHTQDNKMVVDYDHFDDVVCLDTSYRMNKDLQPFVQFIGVKHHNQAIILVNVLLNLINWLLKPKCMLKHCFLVHEKHNMIF